MDHRNNRPCSTKKCGSTGKRVFQIFVVGAVATAFIAMFNDSDSRRGVTPPPEPERLDRMSHRRLTNHVADNGVIGGALAAEKRLAVIAGDDDAPDVHVRPNTTVNVSVPNRPMTVRASVNKTPHPTPAIRLTGLKSRTPQATPELAKEEVYQEAQKQLMDKLLHLDEPIRYAPSLSKIRDSYAQPDTMKVIQPTEEDKKLWVEANLDPDRVWVEMDVEISSEQLRSLRSEDRLLSNSLYIEMVFVLVAALFGFFRLDALTKGYLTWVLGIGIVGVVTVLVAVIAIKG